MFERFTDRARRVIVLAQEEARQLDHSYIGTEHIILGLIHEGEGVAAKVLADLGVSIDAARDQITNIVGTGGGSPLAHIPFTPRCKKVLELSLRESLQFGHNYIGTEHLLLALIREGQGIAIQILGELGITPEHLRERVVETLVRAGTPPIPRYMRSPGDTPTYIDAALPGITALLNEGWTLVERNVDQVTCPDCGTTHACSHYVEVEATP